MSGGALGLIVAVTLDVMNVAELSVEGSMNPERGIPERERERVAHIQDGWTHLQTALLSRDAAIDAVGPLWWSVC